MKRFVILSALLLPALLLVSCSDEGTKPVRSTTPEFIHSLAPDQTGLAQARRPIEPGRVTNLALAQSRGSTRGSRTTSGTAPAGSTTVFSDSPVTVTIKAAEGGTVTAGRYSVWIPPKALQSNTQITIVPNPEGSEVGCQLLPHGLQFKYSAILSMNLTGTDLDGDELTGVTIYWFDQNSGAWVDLHGVFEPWGHKVWVGLPHFSVYRAGRAGW